VHLNVVHLNVVHLNVVRLNEAPAAPFRHTLAGNALKGRMP
jgi:hypothetical protein